MRCDRTMIRHAVRRGFCPGWSRTRLEGRSLVNTNSGKCLSIHVPGDGAVARTWR